MSSKPSGGDAPGAKSQSKPPVFMTLVIVIAGVWIGLGGAGGGLYYLSKSGKLSIPAAGGGAAATAVTHAIVLEPILVNLADEGGHAYLRLGLTLDVEDDAAGAAEKPEATSGDKAGGGKVASPAEMSVRDRVLTVLGRQTSAYLLGPDGKEHLKLELKDELERNGSHMKIKDLFFTDFLVQI